MNERFARASRARLEPNMAKDRPPALFLPSDISKLTTQREQNYNKVPMVGHPGPAYSQVPSIRASQRSRVYPGPVYTRDPDSGTRVSMPTIRGFRKKS